MGKIRQFATLLALFISWNVQATPSQPIITVEKSAQCGCCQAWIDYLRQQGWSVSSHDVSDTQLTQRKQQLGILPAQQSCHTAKVGKYVLEGHVPSTAIHKLLQQRPSIIGLSVPDMPTNAPGMGIHRAGTLSVETIRHDGRRIVFSVE